MTQSWFVYMDFHKKKEFKVHGNEIIITAPMDVIMAWYDLLLTIAESGS